MSMSFCDLNRDQFPCEEGSIVLVSMGLAAAGLGLLMVAFLMAQVSFDSLISLLDFSFIFGQR
jgi:hypothetical protein